MSADLVLWLRPADARWACASVARGTERLEIVTKADLAPASGDHADASAIPEDAGGGRLDPTPSPRPDGPLHVSALTGAGLPTLLDAIAAAAARAHGGRRPHHPRAPSPGDQ